ncbi:MAG TPA: helix-turn-helix domain-containing protein [Opitutaceae bacterium]|jgi:DNA-binding HxlR family transcriptional regulator|nr:helix-turn-helix domain-containing protein [Opitutaceae bacterium]
MTHTRRSSAVRRSPCPIGCSLDLLGDRWTLLIIRDLFLGKSRYGEFAASPEEIPTNLLADRLARLEKAELIKSTPYQQNPPRHAYTLTRKGRDLEPVLAALVKWGKRHVPGTFTQDEIAASRLKEP